MMKQMIEQIMQDREITTKIVSEKEYNSWAGGFIFDGLRNQRYGQSFCNHFNIKDHILFYASTVADADRYILKTYVRRG